MRPALWIGVPAALVLALLAIANRAAVLVSFYPLPWVAKMPLYQVFFAGLVLGLIGGTAGAWWLGRHTRRDARRFRRAAKAEDENRAGEDGSNP